MSKNYYDRCQNICMQYFVISVPLIKMTLITVNLWYSAFLLAVDLSFLWQQKQYSFSKESYTGLRKCCRRFSKRGILGGAHRPGPKEQLLSSCRRQRCSGAGTAPRRAAGLSPRAAAATLRCHRRRRRALLRPIMPSTYDLSSPVRTYRCDVLPLKTKVKTLLQFLLQRFG